MIFKLVFSALLLKLVQCDGFGELHLSPTEPNMGRECAKGEAGKPGIRFYRDRSIKCPFGFAFGYKGCGGDDNNYEDRHLIMMTPWCPGFHVHPTHNQKMGYCPEGFEIGPSVNGDGLCCESYAVDAFWRESKGRACPQNERAYQLNYNVLYGRKCSHNFCPENTNCVQGEVLAFCCYK